MGLVALGFGCAAATVLLSAGVRSLRGVSLIDTTLFPDDDVAKKETLQAKDATA